MAFEFSPGTVTGSICQMIVCITGGSPNIFTGMEKKWMKLMKQPTLTVTAKTAKLSMNDRKLLDYINFLNFLPKLENRMNMMEISILKS